MTFFTFLRFTKQLSPGYLLNTTLYVPGVGVSVAALDLAKCGSNRFQSFVFIVFIVLSILLNAAF